MTLLFVTALAALAAVALSSKETGEFSLFV
jgi:hypothetical protein